MRGVPKKDLPLERNLLIHRASNTGRRFSASGLRVLTPLVEREKETKASAYAEVAICVSPSLTDAVGSSRALSRIV
jgi:hypothetical protein